VNSGEKVSLTVPLGVVHRLVGAQHGERMVGQGERVDDGVLWQSRQTDRVSYLNK